MAIVTFRFASAGWRPDGVDALNRAIATQMQEEGFALVLSTELRGQIVLRLCTINPRTTEEDVANTIKVLGHNARKAMAGFG